MRRRVFVEILGARGWEQFSIFEFRKKKNCKLKFMDLFQSVNPDRIQVQATFLEESSDYECDYDSS